LAEIQKEIKSSTKQSVRPDRAQDVRAAVRTAQEQSIVVAIGNTLCVLPKCERSLTSASSVWCRLMISPASDTRAIARRWKEIFVISFGTALSNSAPSKGIHRIRRKF